jgi:hypothetical protein
VTVPSKTDHIAKAQGNETFVSGIELTASANIDWALTATFYAAVHYIEAYLAIAGTHLRSHKTRDSVVGRDSILKPIFKQYSDLKYFAYNARYEVMPFSPSDVTAIAIPALANIKSQLLPLF